MADNFDNPYSANLVGLWDFRDGYTTDDSGLGDGIAQDGVGAGGATYAGGWMLGNGSDSQFNVAGDQDGPFDLATGSLITSFKATAVPGSGEQTVVSRGLSSQDDADGESFVIRVSEEGVVSLSHADDGNTVDFASDPGFFAAGDLLTVSYGWSPGGVTLVVENSTQGTSFTTGDDVVGMTLDVTADGEDSFVIGADGDGGNAFEGSIDYVAVLDDNVVQHNGGGLDGIVEGSTGDDLIDTGYLGDPEGDRIDNGDAINPADGPDDDLVNAGSGDDTVLAGAGDDTVHGGSGADSLSGGAGDDVLQGDTDVPGGVGGGGTREVFQWDLAPDPDGGDPVDPGDDLTAGFSQDTGSVTVDFSVSTGTGAPTSDFTDVPQFVGNINTGGVAADPQSGLNSATSADASSADYQLDFSGPVGDVSFRVSDIDADSVVNITAFDAAGNPVVVNLAGGPGLTMTDTDAVSGYDTAAAKDDDTFTSDDNPNTSMLVTIPGPVTSIVITHSQDGNISSSVVVSDVFFDALGTPPSVVPGDDTIDGGDGDDIILGNDGDDSLIGGDGSDSVDGGEGDDVIDTSSDDLAPLPDRGFDGYTGTTPNIPFVPADADPFNDRDTVDGGAGDDLITTGDDNDLIAGGAGFDTIDGGIDDDTIDGGTDDDVITGGEGSDSLLGGAGDDTLYGGLDPAFPDALNIMDDGADGRPVDPDPTNGMDTIDGGAGNDVIYGQDDDDLITGGSGDDFIDAGIDDDTVDGGDGSDIVLGGHGDDLLAGGDGVDLVLGGSGDDDISGNAGIDILGGGEGDDTIDGGADTDLMFGGEGSDSLTGGADSDLLVGGDGDDILHGDVNDGDEGNSVDGAADILLGGSGDDTILGGTGGDLIDGGEGADLLVGGADEDVFIEVGPGDVIDGSETGIDNDTVVINGPAVINYDPANPENGTIDFYDLTTQTVIGTATFSNIENVLFVEDVINPTSPLPAAPAPPPSGDDVPAAPLLPGARPLPGDGVVEGTAGSDVIDTSYLGDPDGDLIDAGDALLPGEVGDDDIVLAGDGGDTVISGAGDDEVFGEGGDDLIEGGSGDDVLRGESGADTVYGETGEDEVSGGLGDDLLGGGAGDDVVSGGEGNDTLTGDDGNDLVAGGAGDDSLSGGEGNDLLSGGAGADTVGLDSDSGLDLAFGGIGSDSFTGMGQGDTIYGGEDADGSDIDVLDLTGAAEAQNAGGSLTVDLDDTNPENGVVTFFDASGAETGTANFYEIETVVVPCFTPGTRIATPEGERRVEDLAVGDRVITRDNGIQVIRWLGTRSLESSDLKQAEHLQPILIREGALGNGLPERDMMVSPNHRVLVANDKTALYFEDREVLVAAKHLTGLVGIDAVETSSVTYIHFMFDQHEVVLSDGAWTESFQPGDQTLRGLDNTQRNEVFELFPELKSEQGRVAYSSARRSLKRHEARLLVH